MESSSWNKGYQTMGDYRKSAVSSVLNALKGIPEDLKDIFTPKSSEELIQFEENVFKFAKRSKEREEVIRVQKKYGLPLRPNMPMWRTMTFIRLAELKKKKNNPPSTESSGDTTS